MNNEDSLASGNNPERGFPSHTMRTNKRNDTTTERSTASYQTHDGRLKIVDETTDADAWIRGDATEVRE